MTKEFNELLERTNKIIAEAKARQEKTRQTLDRIEKEINETKEALKRLNEMMK